MRSSFVDRLLVGLHLCLPARLMGRLIYRLSRIRATWFKNLFIRGFCALFPVVTTEAAAPVPDGYASFNDFFTRELRPDARPVVVNDAQLLCPVDGTVAQRGFASAGELMQAKQHRFSAAELLADPVLAATLADAAYTTIYLAPYNYHRIHMPLSAELRTTHFVPGKLYSVNARTTAVIPNLYAINERLVCEFASAHGPFALVLVGAMNVASISTAWCGEIVPDPGSGIVTTRYPAGTGPQLAQGDYAGHFNMGSTIVLLGPPTKLEWLDTLQTGQAVQMGAPIGRIASA